MRFKFAKNKGREILRFEGEKLYMDGLGGMYHVFSARDLHMSVIFIIRCFFSCTPIVILGIVLHRQQGVCFHVISKVSGCRNCLSSTT